jgi:hypothetical protein
LACEGALLASNVSSGDTTSVFARVHASDLAHRASNFEDALSERPTAAGIEHAVRALAQRAGRVANLLEALERRPSDRPTARDIEARLANAGDCR